MIRMEDEQNFRISDQRTLFLVNTFILTTIGFINRLSVVCQEKLANVHRKILRLETTLSLLEDKLRSVDGLAGVEETLGLDDLPELLIPTTNQSQNGGSSLVSEVSSSPQRSISTVEHLPDHMVASMAEEKLASTIKDDPRFSRFFRMLHFGVPQQAVKMQMSIEGYDPALLDEPDALLNVA